MTTLLTFILIGCAVVLTFCAWFEMQCRRDAREERAERARRERERTNGL